MEFVFPEEADLRLFVQLITSTRYKISRYVPATSDFWFETIFDCVSYIKSTAHYESDSDIYEVIARLLYKIVKRHELGDGNKRSAVIAVYLFCLLNDYAVTNARALKNEATRVARSRGRANENLIRKRIAKCLKKFVIPMSPRS